MYFFMLSTAIKNLLCFFYCMMEAKKKFRSTKILCDNKKFRLANNIDAYAITFFSFLGVAIEREAEKLCEKVTRSFVRCILYCETFSNFYFTIFLL